MCVQVGVLLNLNLVFVGSVCNCLLTELLPLNRVNHHLWEWLAFDDTKLGILAKSKEKKLSTASE